MKKLDPSTQVDYPSQVVKKKSDSVKKKSTKSYPAHYAGILLEEIRDQVKIVAKAVDLTREELSQKIEEGDRRLEQKIDDTATALGIRIDRVEVDLSGVKSELSGVKSELSDVKSELSDVKSELSGKIDKIGGRLDRHDREIHELKKAQNLG